MYQKAGETEKVIEEKFKAIVKPVAQCSNDDILAADIFTEQGLKLLSANTVINEYIRHHLHLNGIYEVTVYCGGFSGESSSPELTFERNYKQSVLDIRDLFLDISDGKKPDFDKIKEISDNMISYVEPRQFACVSTLINQIHSADLYTYTHCVDVGFYSMFIAKWLGLSDSEISGALMGGLLHDIGKTRIPAHILNKPGKLTPDEYECMKLHPVEGYRILLDIPEVDRKAKQAVLLHHERLDGSGYPLGIPPHNIISRIIAVADVYDAITTDRVYKKGDSPFKAFEFFLGPGFSLFERSVTKNLITNIAAALIGSRITLETGEPAEIVYIPPNDPLKLIVKLGSDFLEARYADSGYRLIESERKSG